MTSKKEEKHLFREAPLFKQITTALLSDVKNVPQLSSIPPLKPASSYFELNYPYWYLCTVVCFITIGSATLANLCSILSLSRIKNSRSC